MLMLLVWGSVFCVNVVGSMCGVLVGIFWVVRFLIIGKIFGVISMNIIVMVIFLLLIS